MKWMVASDIHGSGYWCEKLVEAFAREGADKLLLLGDILYHGPRNPLPEGHDPQRCAALLGEMKEKVVSVRGNCDAAIDQVMLSFPAMADYLLLDLGEKLVFATHGDQWGEENPPAMAKGGVLLTGHTHVSACVDHGDFLYLNPGSAALPKDEGHHGYLLLDKDGTVFCEMDGTVYRKVTF